MLARLRSGLRIAALCAGLLGSLAGAVTTASAQSDSAADDRAQSFQAVSGAVKEDVAGGPLMLAAYAIVWLAVFGYVFRLVRLQRGVEADLSRLERSLGDQSRASR